MDAPRAAPRSHRQPSTQYHQDGPSNLPRPAARPRTSAFDPVPGRPEMERRVNAFAVARSVDRSAVAAIKSLQPVMQLRLLRRYEAMASEKSSPVGNLSILIQATVRDKTPNFAATAAELRNLAGLELRHVADVGEEGDGPRVAVEARGVSVEGFAASARACQQRSTRS